MVLDGCIGIQFKQKYCKCFNQTKREGSINFMKCSSKNIVLNYQTRNIRNIHEVQELCWVLGGVPLHNFNLTQQVFAVSLCNRNWISLSLYLLMSVEHIFLKSDFFLAQYWSICRLILSCANTNTSSVNQIMSNSHMAGIDCELNKM